jgi:hypothetical protein
MTEALPEAVEIEVVHFPVLCFVMEHAGVPLIRDVIVKNRGLEVLRGGSVTLQLVPDLGDPKTVAFPELHPGEDAHLGPVDLRTPPGKLRQILEAERACIDWTFAIGGEQKLHGESDIQVLAYNEWPASVAPELLVSFVTPNHPVIMGVLRRVADALEKETGDGALSGYQSRSKARVLRSAEALHRAVQSFGIGYAEVPASFTSVGQKVRLADAVMGEQLGDCVDLTLLFASCLEQMGLRPILVLVEGHAFLAVWLIEELFPEGIIEDGARLRNQIALGNLLPIDATIAVASNQPTFDSAVAAAQALLDNDERFVVALDVRALRSKYLPLPIRRVSQPSGELDATSLGPPSVEVRRILAEASHEPEPAPGPRSQPPADPVAARFHKWQEKLLDLSLRNRLLSFSRDAKTVLPLNVVDLPIFEDRIARDEVFEIVAKPNDQAVDGSRDAKLTATDQAGAAVRLHSDFKAGRIGADLPAAELWTRAVGLDRASRTALEEGGANILFVAVGVLRWFETNESEKARSAPLLLYPATLEFDRRKRRVRVRRLTDDPIANVTLVEKMSRDFGVDLAPMADLQPDESGVDVATMLRRARESVQRIPRWEVLEESCVGLFSFTKFLMWKDLRDNAQTLLRNPVVRHLAFGSGAFVNEQPPVLPEQVDDEVPPNTLPCVVDADSTQIAAIAGALRGRSFVLQGPPGTGKSQTITSLIAATLSQGKSVLFVSEKMAALDVVRRRLSEVGIDDFCLELHSSKANKKAVLDSLAKTFNRRERHSAPQWEERCRELTSAREIVNAYAIALHAPRQLGLTLHQASARLLELASTKNVVLTLDDIASWTGEHFRALQLSVADFSPRASSVEPTEVHPWRAYTPGIWSTRREQQIADAIAAISPALKQVDEAGEELGRTFAIEAPGSTEAIEALVGLAGALAQGVVPAAAGARFEGPTMAARGRALVEAQQQQDRLLESLSRRWSDAFLASGVEIARKSFDRYSKSASIVAFFQLFGARRRLRACHKGRIGTNSEIAADLALAVEVRKRQALLDSEREWLAQTLEVDLPGTTEALASLVERVIRVAAEASSFRRAAGSELDFRVVSAVPAILARAAYLRANASLGTFTRAEDNLRSLLNPSVWPDRRSSWHRSDLLKTAMLLASSIGKLRFWCSYQESASALEGIGLGAVSLAHKEGVLSADELSRAFEKTVLSNWVSSLRESEPALRSFDGEAHHRAVERFRRLDREHLQLSRAFVVHQLEQQLPRSSEEHPDSSETGILLRETCKKTRHVAVRRLLQEIPNLLRRLKPCLLMSPLSIAQYLPADGQRFDLVVFDEASQIGTHDAIGAIARGKQVVIVGDSKQLPPTTFFVRQGEDENAIPDENDVVEVESILDEAYAKQLPSQMLGWHYRSRHESLIEFSNRHYYEGKLHVFPAAFSDVDDLGVSLRHVPDGVYESGDRARTNPIEARALVDELVVSLKRTKPGDRTFGVVTFSAAQQSLVQDLLDEQRAATPEIESHFSGPEAVFVKNLENVQGDERDEIFFSVCYAKNSTGKLRMHFGPLSATGGERRLNVAVTRARRRCVYFPR